MRKKACHNRRGGSRYLGLVRIVPRYSTTSIVNLLQPVQKVGRKSVAIPKAPHRQANQAAKKGSVFRRSRRRVREELVSLGSDG
jgi:hypothetical protein